MHLISKIIVENFKSIKSAEFSLSSYTPLVGYNNAGKTNILQALNWLIKKSSLPESYFFDRDKSITVTAEISGISDKVLAALQEKHRNKIEPLVIDEKITIKRVQSKPEVSISEIKFEIYKTDKSWAPSPTGIDEAILNLFPEPIFIGAMEDAAEDVSKYATGTTIGKLIKEIVEDVSQRYSAEVTTALKNVETKLSGNSKEKDASLEQLDKQIQAELKKIFPGVTAKTHIPPPDFSDFFRKASIQIFEDNFDDQKGRDAISFGHGTQRSVQFALIKCLADRKRMNTENQHRTTLLLIDEPELYLHPQAIELVRASLKSLSREGYQVAFTTHSANMIPRNDAANTLIIRRDKENGTKALTSLANAIKIQINNASAQSETLFELTNSMKILFSQKVILVEGKTEKTILPEIFAYHFKSSLDEKGVGLIPLGGSTNIPNAKKVLNAMGIENKSIVDLDFAFQSELKDDYNLKNNTDIKKCKEILISLENDNKIKLDTNGLPTKSENASAEEAYKLMAEHKDAQIHIDSIHNDLLKNNIWIWKKGAIEAHLGLNSKENKIQKKFIDELKLKNNLQDIPDWNGVVEMLEWIIS